MQEREEKMINEQGFFRVDQALIRIKNGEYLVDSINEIREEMKIMQKYLEQTSNLKDQLHRRNALIKKLRETIKTLGEGLNAIRDTFYDTKQNPQVFIGNVEAILNATKNKL